MTATWEELALDAIGPLRLPRAYCPVEPTLKQDWFLRRDELEAFFGGAAGPGKSWGLFMAALQYVDSAGYHGLLLRPQLNEFEQPGGLIEVSHDWLDMTDAYWNGSKREWAFPSGATIRFGYLSAPGHLRQYKGPSYSFCVARSTGIRMGDGTVKAIEDVQVGDRVQTLIGPQPVTRTHRMGIKPCARLATPQGVSVVSMEHRVLTATGWASPSDLMSTAHRKVEPMHAASLPSLRVLRTQSGRRPSNLLQAVLRGLRRLGRVALRVTGASSRDEGSDCGVSGGGRQADRQPLGWFVPLVLHEPNRHRGEPDVALSSPRRAPGREMFGHGSLGSTSGYPTYPGFDDGRPRRVRAADRAHIPLRAVIAACIRWRARSDGQANIRSGSCPSAVTGVLRHPYTNATLDVREAVRVRVAGMSRVGDAEVFDLTVAGASHYITDAGIVSANCGFDELTGFPEWAYRAMFRVLRQAKGRLDHIPLRMRSASNPGDIGHQWVKARFVEKATRVKGVVYVPAWITDNPHLDYDEYLKSLAHLSPIDQERLIRGDWDVTEEGGKFSREAFKIVEPNTVKTPTSVVRYWDLAGSEVSPAYPDPDWTVGLKLEVDAQGIFTVRHIVRGRWADTGVESNVKQTALEDGTKVPIHIEKDPGQAGKAQLSNYKRIVLPGYAVHDGLTKLDGKSAAKEVRSRPVAAAVGNGLVQIASDCPNLIQFLDECAIFPNGNHDDIVDTLSGAHNAITGRARKGGSSGRARGRLPGVDSDGYTTAR